MFNLPHYPKVETTLLIGGEIGKLLKAESSAEKFCYEFSFPNGCSIQIFELAENRYRIAPRRGTSFKEFFYFSERNGEEGLRALFQEIRKLPPAVESALSSLNVPNFDRTVVAESTLTLCNAVDTLQCELRKNRGQRSVECAIWLSGGLERLSKLLHERYDLDYGRQARRYIQAGLEDELGGVPIEQSSIHYTSFEEFSKFFVQAFMGGSVDKHDAMKLDTPLKAFCELGTPLLERYFASGFVARVKEELVAKSKRAWISTRRDEGFID